VGVDEILTDPVVMQKTESISQLTKIAADVGGWETLWICFDQVKKIRREVRFAGKMFGRR
jgi:hypothetical protein